MKIKKTFWARMVPVILLAIITTVLSAFIYRSMINAEKETCWDRLRNATESTAQKIQVRLTDNLNFLDAVADSYVLKNHLEHEDEVGKYMNSVMEMTIFERIDVILPDGGIITQSGEVVYLEGELTFDELAEKGTHVSPRTTCPFTGNEVIYCFTPVTKNGEIIAMLCGTIDCVTMSEIFEVFTYKGESQLFLIDCADGAYLIDNWHGELGNVYEMGTRIDAETGEEIDMVPLLINREVARISYISETNGENSYQYSAPVDGFNWVICVVVQQDVVFRNVNKLRGTLEKVGIVEIILLIAFIAWNIRLNLSAVKSEKRVRELELTKATNEAKSRFISNMSHDIRTPLNGIMGMLHIIKTHRDDEELVDSCIDKIEVSTQYLTTLSSDMLEINEIENDKLVLENKPLDLVKLANELSVINEPKAEERKVKFSIDCSELDNPYVLGSAVHIERILVNLISNAIKYSKDEDAYVKVTFEQRDTTENGANYCFIVEDNGIGMSEEFQKNMYTAFAQETVTARSSYQGYGLGLTIVFRLVDKMGGRIELESKKNVGTRFAVTLPLAINDDYEPDEAQESGACDISGLRVLLVEDNSFNMEFASVILSDAGAIVTPAENGKIATDIFANSPLGHFDLILMDIMMPEMDGCEATTVIRNMYRVDAKTIPIFAMTANTFDEEINRYKEAGMNEHIAKPIDIQKLMSVISRYCKQDNNNLT